MKICQYATGDECLQSAIDTLRSGGLVVCPSDTVYGLLVDATNPEAVSTLIALKNRPAGKPISVFVENLQTAKQYVSISQQQETMLNSFLPGPFTIILPARGNVDTRLISEQQTLGIRIPDFPFITRLSAKFGKPVTATSANLVSQNPHYRADSFLKSLSDKKKEMIDLLIDAGELPHHKPSTVVDLTKEQTQIIRQGDLEWVRTETVTSHSPEETVSLGERMVQTMQKRRRQRPVVVMLKGDLGAGKTIMVKGIARALNIHRIISPTYVIAAEYPIPQSHGSCIFHHLDLYAIQSDEELRHIGFSHMLQPGNIICIEWGDKAGSLDAYFKKTDKIFITLRYVSEHERSIAISYGWYY